MSVNDPSAVARAAKLSHVPGVTIAEACDRFDVTRSVLQKARRDPATKPTLAELALAALTENGTLARGSVQDLEGVASWLDYINHDASTVEDVRALLATRPELVIAGETWELVEAWP